MSVRTAARFGLPLLAAAIVGGAAVAVATRDQHPSTGTPAGPAPRLVAFSSCTELDAELRAAATRFAGTPGWSGDDALPGVPDPAFARDAAAADAAGAAQPRAVAPAAGAAAERATGDAGPGYSGTNSHEASADEPDLVKTDGTRIVTTSGGTLRVIDAARHTITGSLDLGSVPGARYQPADLLLSGDRVMVLLRNVVADVVTDGAGAPDRVAPGGFVPPEGLAGPTVLLVDIAARTPRLVGRYTMDGQLVDARQTGDTVRIVARSSPRLQVRPHLDEPAGGSPARRDPGPAGGEPAGTAANREQVTTAGPEQWLPRYAVDTGTGPRTGQVPCESVSRPTAASRPEAPPGRPADDAPVWYTGTSLLTVATFDLRAPNLGTGDPVSVVADGQTVYGTGSRLYVAGTVWPAGRPGTVPAGPASVVFAFDTAGSGRPRYLASGSVPGSILNQYALSEWQGVLRVATTDIVSANAATARVTSGAAGPGGEPGVAKPLVPPVPAVTESAVYLLRRSGRTLSVVGAVTGLGRTERIHGVRFIGPTGYVVTFRRTDPLFVIDLRDPERPRLRGELAITGYSAYLHPLDGDRLLGVGQEATTQGQPTGTQLSLFDVADPAAPRLLARHHVEAGHSEAEFDPHAFLYWPATRTLVLPLTTGKALTGDPRRQPESGALVLVVTAKGFTAKGTIQHPAGQFDNTIRRSLVIGRTLWTVSAAGLRADDLDTLAPVAWIPLS